MLRPKALIILVAVFFLSGCGVFSKSTPQPLPTVNLDTNQSTPSAATPVSGGGGVTASGIIVPGQEVQIASTTGGNITSLTVSEGDIVTAGQVLATLAGSEKLAAGLEASRLELLSAQQDLQTLNDNAVVARTAAQLKLANAQKALDDAQKIRSYRQYRNGSQSSINTAQADFILAKDTLDKASNYYSGFEGKPEDDINRAAALSALGAAQKAYDRALANLNYLKALPNAIDVNQAEAELQSAQAERDAAQVEFDRLKNGPDPDILALAQERVKNAQAQVAASQTALADLELKAPFAGTIGKINVHSGEWAAPGQTILVLADLAHLKVETTDLSERDIPQVKVGQAVTVLVKALNQELPGKVGLISPLSDTIGGDVVYKTTIALNSGLAGVRAGMSVEVSFGGQ